LKTLFPLSQMHMCYKLFTTLGYGELLAKNTFRTKNWQGAGLGEHPQNFGTPYLFLQLLNLTTSNLIHNFD